MKSITTHGEFYILFYGKKRIPVLRHQREQSKRACVPVLGPPNQGLQTLNIGSGLARQTPCISKPTQTNMDPCLIPAPS